MTILTAIEWSRFLGSYPDAHLLQTSEWAIFKSGFGWDVQRVSSGDTGVQILFKTLPFGVRLAYIPKGPVGPDWKSLWPEVHRVCRRMRAVILKVEPDINEPYPDSLSAQLPGFHNSEHCIQPRRTIILSLEGDENQWLARMKQKTRYNIRLAEKKEVQIHPSGDVDTFYRLMELTGRRDRFGVHSREYFHRVYELFHPLEMCKLFLAEYAGQPLAGLMAFARGKRAWYFYGASNDAERSRMPAYLLQWHAMLWAKSRGCSEYDLWGIPDADENVLEADFENRSDGLWGVYRFKRGFGGALTRTAGAWDYPYLPLVYQVYRLWERKRGEQG